MKYLAVVLFAVVVAASAEAPRRNSPKFQRTQAAPYPAAGFRPSQEFKLPERRPQPQTVYGAPQQQYGPPEVTTEADATTTDASADFVEPNPKELKKQELVENLDEGVYYVYHPSGALQRIVYATKNDLKNMAYTAQFKYQDVQPIRDPIFTYDPETLILKQVVV